MSADRSAIVSSLGWVDRGGLWVYSDRGPSVRSIRLGAANYLSLRAGTDDHFAVVHHGEGHVGEITVHRFPEVEQVLARAVIGAGDGMLSGDVDAFARVPRYYTGLLTTPSWADFGLITIDVPEGRVLLSPFPWFDDDSYDKMYQGIVGVAEIPDSPLLLISVQRTSTVVIHDPATSRKMGEVKVGDGGGNPALYFRRTAPELWADDYDTLVRLDAATWRVLDRRRLQDADSGTRQFIGQFTIDAAEELCAVARPFSRDVVGVDVKTFEVRLVASMAGQPLEVAMLAGNRVIARDWKSGALLTGEFRRET